MICVPYRKPGIWPVRVRKLQLKKMAGYTSGQIDMILQKHGQEPQKPMRHVWPVWRWRRPDSANVLDKTYKNHAASTLLIRTISKI